MKIIYFSTFILCLCTTLLTSQTVRGTIERTDAYEVTIKAKADAPVSNTNDLAILATISIPEVSGQPAPIVAATTPLVGTAIAPQAIEVINNRWVYAFSLTGSTPINWLADVENDILVVTFPENPLTTVGVEVNLDDYTGTGSNSGSALWYVELQADDYTNYVTKFYADLPNQNANNSEAGDSNVDANAPLPIKLTSFTAIKFEENSGKLDWSSSSEVNGSHFEIERSTDNRNWEKLGVVKAVGESTQRNDYQFIDRNVGALRSNTTFYYRLKMVDNDASFEYSAVRSITFTAEGVTINIYPNPTTDKVSINMSTEAALGIEDANVTFRSIDGKILLKNKISSNGITEINLNDVPSGLILLQIDHNNKIYTERIIKID